jgi:hypothetical protein
MPVNPSSPPGQHQSDNQSQIQADPIDLMMERASTRLLETDYFGVVSACRRALDAAVKAKDWDRLARLVLPLQEARRQIRQIAVDLGRVVVISSPEALRRVRAGCFLIRPPLIGADARAFRLAAEARGLPTLVLAREPMTDKGLWPIVGVSDITVRTRVPPPPGAVFTGQGVTRDRFEGEVPVPWFQAAAEALGDAGIASLDLTCPAAHRVEDLIDRLEAVPEHEKLHQRLADAARDAMRQPAPTSPRRRGPNHPFSF